MPEADVSRSCRGADIIIIDDPLKPEEALSDAQRQACNEWYDHTLYSRQNDKRLGSDSPVEEAVSSEPVSTRQIPW